MGHVTIGHQKIVRTNGRLQFHVARSVDRDMLTERVSLADAEPGGFALVFKVLRGLADHAAGKKSVIGPRLGFTREVNARSHNASGAKLDILVNDGVRPDTNGGIQLRLRMNDSGRMNHSPLKKERIPQVAKKKLTGGFRNKNTQAPAAT